MDSRLLAAILVAIGRHRLPKSGDTAAVAATKAGGMGIQVVAVPALKRPGDQNRCPWWVPWCRMRRLK